MSQPLDIHGKKYNRILMIVVVMIGAFATVLNQTLLATALPTIMKVFEVSTATAQWLTTGFMLINGIMIPISAWLSTNISTKWLYISTMLIFLGGTVLSYTADSFSVLLMGRLIQGIGVGIVMPLLQTMMLAMFPAEKRGASLGLAGIVVGLAPALGPTLSGYVLDNYSWRVLFGMLIPVISLVLIGAFLFMKDVLPIKKSKIDVFSVMLSSLGFGSLLYGFSSAGNDGWGDTVVISTLLIGGIFILLFGYRQMRIDEPLLNLSVFLNKQFMVGTILSSLVNLAMIGFEMVLPLYLQDLVGDTPFESGLALLPGALMIGLMSLIAGRLFDKHGIRNLAVSGLFILIIGTLPFVFLTATTPRIYIIFLYGVRMFGIALVMMTTTTSAMNALPESQISHGTAANNTFKQIAASMGTAVMVSVLSTVTKSKLPATSLKEAQPLLYAKKAVEATLNGYSWTFALSIGFALIGLLIALTLNKKTSHTTIKEVA